MKQSYLSDLKKFWRLLEYSDPRWRSRQDEISWLEGAKLRHPSYQSWSLENQLKRRNKS